MTNLFNTLIDIVGLLVVGAIFFAENKQPPRGDAAPLARF